MGHLGHLKEEYRALVGRLDAGAVALPEPRDPRAWQGWKEILEILYTPEDAALAARLPVAPTGLGALAKRLGVSEDELRPRLEAMCDRGLVLDLVSPRTGKAKYLLSPPVVGFFEWMLHDRGRTMRRLAGRVLLRGRTVPSRPGGRRPGWSFVADVAAIGAIIAP
jgi:hypothetical protein